MMKKISVVLAGVAVAVMAVSAGSASAQDAMSMKRKAQSSNNYSKKGSAKYRPLTVQAPASAENSGPNSLGTPITGALGVVGSTVTGAASLAVSPLQALGGAPVGISPDPAPPLPIKARYAGTGKVVSSYDQGYAQDVPVDASGPIYKIDDKAMRSVTPFTLAAFPVAGLASAITTPLRAATP